MDGVVGLMKKPTDACVNYVRNNKLELWKDVDGVFLYYSILPKRLFGILTRFTIWQITTMKVFLKYILIVPCHSETSMG